MNKHVAMFAPALQGTDDGLEGLSQQSLKAPHRAQERAAALDSTGVLHPVTRENVRDWSSVVVTRNGPKHLWGTEWKLSREHGNDLAAWFCCAETRRWRDIEHVLLFTWLSGMPAEPLKSAAPLQKTH
jgi:hypothetical protein